LNHGRPQLKKGAADIANSLRIGQTNLKQINEIRNLGVVMDTSLSWQSQIKRSSSRMNSAPIQLARIKHLILRSGLRHAIQALAFNHLHYYTIVWNTAGTSATAPVRSSHRMAERLARSQFKDLNLLCREKIKVLRSRITQKRSSHYINNCLLLNPKGRAKKPLTRTKKGQNQLVFRCVVNVFCSFLFSPHFILHILH